MVTLPLLLFLLVGADASSSITSCAHHTRRTREHFPALKVSLAFQSYGRRYVRNRTPINDRRCTRFPAAKLDTSDATGASCNQQTAREASQPTPSISHCTDDTIPSSIIPLCSSEVSRRAAFFQMLSLSVLSATSMDAASASEIDTSGELFTPKNEMIKGGGSAAARGIRLNPTDRKESKSRRNQSLLKSTGLIQDVYETRFIAYLARFLLVFDPAASAWWKKNYDAADASKETFAEFAESVEVGLADYFLGPYGSYASVAAAKAGIAAAAPAKSVREADRSLSLWHLIGGKGREDQRKQQAQANSAIAKRKSRNAEREATNLARQGVLNLFSLLRARYTSAEEKQQLAILFSLISRPELQPVKEIRGLLGEVDNGTVSAIELVDLSTEEDTAAERDFFRLSSRQGGGFSRSDVQIIRVEPPAPLGDEYKPAEIRAIMKPTTRVLRINVTDGGEGYTVAPDVVVKQKGVSRNCEATAIIDRKGSVSEIIVLNPGFGYGGRQVRQGQEPALPTVEIRERRLRQTVSRKKVVRPAKAIAELEYRIAGVDIINGGSGYLFDQPPTISLDLPAVDPDWFAKPTILSPEQEEDEESQFILATVTEMKSGSDGVTIDTRAARRGKDSLMLGDDVLRSMQNNPIALLPTSIRPQFSKFYNKAVVEKGYYSIPSLPPVQPDMTIPSSTYRSIDPLFGGIGKAPVTKNALTLSSSQYLRLALSGAICTVLVRTALNPLELVKTKIQLGNDDEILQLAAEKASSKQGEKESTSKPSVGTTQVIQSLVEVRGPRSLFQSADITFVTSVVFGLFGFGATELFRRSFSAVFFDESAGPNEFLLLAAAGLATLLTCAAGAPFEILRVRSMSQLEDQGVRQVFDNFVEENRQKRGASRPLSVAPTSSSSSLSAILPTGMQVDDIKPLWSSFNPIVSRELPFAVTKFLVFDLAAGSIANFINGAHLLGDDEIQVGVGSLGLLLSAFAGALAGIAGALVSHPADLILTLTSAASREEGDAKDWRQIVRELLAADGGIGNLFSGFPARAVFFFLVIGLQFFLYDYVKTLLDVGTDDLTLVLDVFYAVRQGLL